MSTTRLRLKLDSLTPAGESVGDESRITSEANGGTRMAHGIVRPQSALTGAYVGGQVRGEARLGSY